MHKKLIIILLLITLGLATAGYTYAQRPSLTERVSGKLLLQVERDGQIWYIDKDEQNRYKISLTNALSMFRKLSLGITNADLAKIPQAGNLTAGDLKLQKRLAGRILLQVEDKGRIWYVDPKTLNRYEVTQANLLDLFRKLSLGISNNDLLRLPKGALASESLPTFNSCADLTSQVQTNVSRSQALNFEFAKSESLGITADAAPPTTPSDTDFSTTNIQVAGVDEADIVKTDGNYIYYVHGGDISIVSALPANQAKIIHTINIDDINIEEIYIKDNRLMVFGRKNNFYNWPKDRAMIYPWYHSRIVTFIRIYDITDRANPIHKRTLELNGSYNTSRLIGDYAYIVLNSYLDYPITYLNEDGQTQAVDSDETEIVPFYQDTAEADFEPKPLTRCSDISYLPPITESHFVTIIALSITDSTKPITKEVILGSSQNVYVSKNNIFITKTDYNYHNPVILEDTATTSILPRSSLTTKIFKLGLNKSELVYYGQAEVKGTVINQFSMDEYDNHFRIATTLNNFSDSQINSLYVLDADLNQVGSIEGIAPGERIFSARFMGDKGYLVTYKKVDPFFTLDLSDHTNPRIAGKLKIPGFSDYLHPYDDNHIIGIGKDAVETEEGNFAWYQGIKMAIFDVSDFSNPKELHRVIIGDRGTDSPLLRDHKALLFNKDRNLLALPIKLAELTDAQKADESLRDNAYGDFTFQGLYVYDISVDNGFVLKGKISHIEDNDEYLKSGYYFRSSSEIKRSLYINNNLYTLSDKTIKINDLNANLVELNKLDLPNPIVDIKVPETVLK